MSDGNVWPQRGRTYGDLCPRCRRSPSNGGRCRRSARGYCYQYEYLAAEPKEPTRQCPICRLWKPESEFRGKVCESCHEWLMED